MNFGKVVEVKTTQPLKPKMVIEKLCGSTPAQIEIYSDEDQYKMEIRL